MCDQRTECRKPENLQGRPEDCSEEQILTCHGDMDNHPCAGSK